jgi:hypothetical protein
MSLPHGYTNTTRLVDGHIVKRYLGSAMRLFRGWGDDPFCVTRRAAMLEVCGRFLPRAESMGDRRAAELWSGRRDATASWAP